VSGPDRVIGLDMATTIIYALAASFFWVEYKLFLIIPTLSSAIGIARVIAPGPMKWYTMSAPILLCLSTLVSFSVLAMIYQKGSDPPPAFFGTLHIVLNGTIGMFLLGSYAVAMTVILRQFHRMRSSKSDFNSNSNNNLQSTGVAPNIQFSKLGSVETKIRRLRNETVFLILVFPPCLITYGAIPEARMLSCYFLPLAWSATGLVTLRFIYMSHQTLMIHLRRARTDPTTPMPNDQQLDTALGSGDQSAHTTDMSPFSSSDLSARSAIRTIARKRKKRRPKFINAMTRVEEEKTNAVLTKVEEALTVMESNEVSRSANA
jgi:hypothetical protein